MYKVEEIKPYDGQEEKGEMIEEMFDSISSTYDTLNHRMSWGIDRRWRKEAIRQLKPYMPKKILDVATGTGDFAILATKMLQPEHLIGADISENMLAIGKKKVAAEGLSETISFTKENCMALSFEDNTFDAVTAAFGIRNFQNLDQGLAEMCRVLKKGGHLSIVELSTPVIFPIRQLYNVYLHTILRVMGKYVSKDSNAYNYLAESIKAFPQGEQMVGILKKAGFSQASFKRMTFGACTMYLATK